MYPLQLPGAPELIVIVLIFALPVAVIALVVMFFKRRRGRLEALEARVRDLEAERDRTD